MSLGSTARADSQRVRHGDEYKPGTARLQGDGWAPEPATARPTGASRFRASRAARRPRARSGTEPLG